MEVRLEDPRRKRKVVKNNYSGREETFLLGNNCFSKKSTA